MMRELLDLIEFAYYNKSNQIVNNSRSNMALLYEYVFGFSFK